MPGSRAVTLDDLQPQERRQLRAYRYPVDERVRSAPALRQEEPWVQLQSLSALLTVDVEAEDVALRGSSPDQHHALFESLAENVRSGTLVAGVMLTTASSESVAVAPCGSTTVAVTMSVWVLLAEPKKLAVKLHV